MFDLPDVRHTAALALAEDLGVDAERLLDSAHADPAILQRDVTTASVVGEDTRFVGRIVAREACVVCGLPVAAEVFELLSRAAGLFEPVDVYPLVAEGTRVAPGTAVAEVDGLARVVLGAERTALNFMMVLSGIATEASLWAAEAGPGVHVCDTRKTVPGMRALSKYAVRVGGATNHRSGLWDMVLVKDNHLHSVGSVSHATHRARAANPGLKIEVEADTVEQAVEATEAGADLVLLDNMDDRTLVEAVAACRAAEARRGKIVLLEVAGNIRRERLAFLGTVGIDRISTSALTMAGPVDFALDDEVTGKHLA